MSAAVPIDPVAAEIITAMEAVFPRIDNLDADAAEVRKIAKQMPGLPEVEEVASVEDGTIPGPAGPVPVRTYRPKGADAESAPGVVYFHGGGWVICDLDTHDGGCRRLANETGAVVMSVDYRLAPEHKYPAAVDDAYAATAGWRTTQRGSVSIRHGSRSPATSAGGNLAAAVALKARDQSDPALVFQLLIYPAIDNSPTCND